MPSSLNGTGVTFNDATTLQTGIIPAGNLASNSVTAVKIADANVTTAKLATNERMTTANVLASTAGASVGAVGTYALLRPNSNITLSPGSTVAGSGFQFTNTNRNNSGVSPSGTWRIMGFITASESHGSVFLRIS